MNTLFAIVLVSMQPTLSTASTEDMVLFANNRMIVIQSNNLDKFKTSPIEILLGKEDDKESTRN